MQESLIAFSKSMGDENQRMLKTVTWKILWILSSLCPGGWGSEALVSFCALDVHTYVCVFNSYSVGDRVSKKNIKSKNTEPVFVTLYVYRSD